MNCESAVAGQVLPFGNHNGARMKFSPTQGPWNLYDDR
jgi:hypothetical protein